MVSTQALGDHCVTHRARIGIESASVYRRFSRVQSAIVPEAIQIALHQSVEKNARAFGYEPKELGLSTSVSQKTLVFCAIRVGSLVANSGTRTTFLLRSPKTEKEQPLTH
jgi:hypothetical protein